jgi:hypothetical protein
LAVWNHLHRPFDEVRQIHRTQDMPIILKFRDCPDSNDIAGFWQKPLHFGSKTVIGARLGDHGYHRNVFGQ